MLRIIKPTLKKAYQKITLSQVNYVEGSSQDKYEEGGVGSTSVLRIIKPTLKKAYQKIKLSQVNYVEGSSQDRYI